MTPEEKAIELYNKMYLTGFKPNSVLIRIEQVKEYALIAADEIITIQQGYAGNRDEFKTYLDYWQEVKQEIEKL
jgi:hypothetical protein